jgi:DNA-directed RNA polymerase specialized sigma24 family protein
VADEAALIRSAASGDTDALEELIRSQAATVYAYLAGMLGDEREAEDAMQETFVRVARAVERYDDATDPHAWIFGIARRVAADIRPTPAAPPGEVPPSNGDVAEWAQRSLRALPIELREVLVYGEILRWEPGRIAKTLGVEPDEVSRRQLDAHAQLASGMRDLGER